MKRYTIMTPNVIIFLDLKIKYYSTQAITTSQLIFKCQKITYIDNFRFFFYFFFFFTILNHNETKYDG